MNALSSVSALRERIDALALRERVLVLAALLVLVVTGWQALFMDRLDLRRRTAQERLTSLASDAGTAESDAASNSMTTALEREHALRRRFGSDERVISNVVMMGMGEPLQNYSALVPALRTSTRGSF